ncbi:DsbA family protein [Moraxella cuniculi]|uniref:DSBA-like thioredoxin domain n=1 Tax=Moraxella cuniculi TaxID=34061 RepID=A0A448GW49_9GAMM|nr:DsbA family protein [Moraxella cuniculi]VEG13026.1 Uncharacterised protein [Moraxella cuniculi]
MQNPLIIYQFTDPMMGLSYESEPFFRQVESHFGEQIRFRPIISYLVRNVADFMIPDDFKEGAEKAFIRYNKRLAQIYQSEQSISGIPIKMDHLELFSPERPSSLPLNLAYKAVELACASKAEPFLYRLRFATVAECRPTTKFDEIVRVVKQCDIDLTAFLQHYQDGSAQFALERDFAFLNEVGVRGLPAYLFEYQGKRLLRSGVLTYADFAMAIRQVSGGQIMPSVPTFSPQALDFCKNIRRSHRLKFKPPSA